MEASTYRNESSSHPRSHHLRLALVLACIVGGVLSAIGYVSVTADTFRPDAHRLLEALATASNGVEFTFYPHPNSTHSSMGNLTLHGVFFPKPNPSNHSSDASADPPHQSQLDLDLDGKVWYEFSSRLYNFTILDNKGFWTIQDLDTREVVNGDCLNAVNLPPLHTIRDSLLNARVVDDVKSRNVNCANPRAKLVEFMFFEEPYVFCATPESKDGTPVVDKIHGEDFEAQLTFLEENARRHVTREQVLLPPPARIEFAYCEPLNIMQPPPETAANNQDQELPSETLHARIASQASQARVLLDKLKFAKTRAQDVLTVATGRRRVSLWNTEECTTCKFGPTNCLFVHGLGLQEQYSEPQDSFEEYWGTVQNSLPCCKTVKFMRMNTMDNAWYDDELTNSFCDAAMALGAGNDNMDVQGVTVVGHSMGNLIIAAAAVQNKCALGNQSRWIASQGPYTGSMASTRALSVCANGEKAKDSKLARVLDYFHLCPIVRGMQSLMFKNPEGCPTDLQQNYNEAMEYHYQRVDAVLCGVSYVGLATSYSFLTTTLSMFAQHATNQNDGAVHIDSCRGHFGEDLFGEDWRVSGLYRASINHGDGSFRHGDGWYGFSRKPVKWLQCQF